MWWNLIGLGIKTGAAIYKNKKQTQILESQARLLHYEKMARGEIEYKGRILDTQDKGVKDEIVLCVVLLPVLILGWSVFSDDPLYLPFKSLARLILQLVIGSFHIH